MRKYFFPLLLPFLLFSLNILGQTTGSTTKPIGSSGEFTEKGGFSMDDNEEHYFLFILNDRPSDLPELRGEITKYIWKNHPQENLKLTQIQIDGELAEVPILHVKSFSNKKEAMSFYRKLKTSQPDFMQMGMTEDFFAISKSNFEKVVRTKSLQGYKPFFAMHY